MMKKNRQERWVISGYNFTIKTFPISNSLSDFFLDYVRFCFYHYFVFTSCTYTHIHTHTHTYTQAVSGIKYIGDDLNGGPVASGHCLGTGTAGVGGIIKCTGGGSIY